MGEATVEHRRTGSIREYLKGLRPYLISALFGAYTLFSAALAYVLSQLPSRFNFLGGGWSTFLLFLIVAVVYAGYRTYSETVRSYERRVAEIFSRRPNLEVGFGTSDGRVTSQIEASIIPVPPVPSGDQIANEQRARLARKYEEAEAEVLEYRRENPFSGLSVVNQRTMVPKDDYDEEIERFIPKWERYLREKRTYELGRSCTIPISPVISNIGPVIANTVTLLIDIPAGLRLASDSEIEAFEDSEEDFRPTPPEDPKAISYRLDLYGVPGLDNYSMSSFVPAAPGPTNSRDPRYLLNGRNQQVQYEVPSITPRRREENLPPFHVVADGFTPQTFQFAIQLFAASLDPPIEQELSLKIIVATKKNEMP